LSKATHKDLSHSIEGPFVLAYQLRRLKLKRDSSVSSMKVFNKVALFDDTTDESTATVWLDDWEIEDVYPETAHDA
jgi:hypothetical protein